MQTIEITPVELYRLGGSPIFVSQSSIDENGNYTMIWELNNQLYKTTNNILS